MRSSGFVTHTQCSSSGRGASRGSQEADDDSDLDEPDMVVHHRRAQREEPRRTAVRADASSTAEKGDGKDGSCAAQSTAGSRARNADILNRVNGTRRARPSAADTAAAELADSRAPSDISSVEVVVPDRRKPKPRAVPDFPPTQAAARSDNSNGSIGNTDGKNVPLY